MQGHQIPFLAHARVRSIATDEYARADDDMRE